MMIHAATLEQFSVGSVLSFDHRQPTTTEGVMNRFADHAIAPSQGSTRVLAPAGSTSILVCAPGTGDILSTPVRWLSGRLSRGFAGTGGIVSFRR